MSKLIQVPHFPDYACVDWVTFVTEEPFSLGRHVEEGLQNNAINHG